MRAQFNNMLGKIMLVMSPERDEYVFDAKKKHAKTLIFGPEYERFLTDFDMKKGDRVRIEWDYPIDVFFAIFPEGADGVSKKRVLEAHVFEDSAKSIVFSKGLTLTAGQTGRMNHHALTQGLGLGHVFVHTITVTDVEHNGLIPREISSDLNTSKSGEVSLISGYAQHQICDDDSVVLILFH